jgi:hypothetical protein
MTSTATARKGPSKPAAKRPKSLRIIALEIGRSPTCVQRWIDRGMPRDGAARSRWIATNTTPLDRLAKQREATADREAADEALLRVRIDLARHRLAKRIALLVNRSTYKLEWRRGVERAEAAFRGVAEAVAATLPPGEMSDVVKAEVGNAVARALAGLKRDSLGAT